MGVAQQVAPAGVGAGVVPQHAHQLGIVLHPGVVSVHQIVLAEVDGLSAAVDVAGAAVVIEQLALDPGDIRRGGMLAVHAVELAVGVQHLLEAKAAVLRRQAKGLEHIGGDAQAVHPGLYVLEQAGLEQQLRVPGMGAGSPATHLLHAVLEIRRRGPVAGGAANIFCPHGQEHL